MYPYMHSKSTMSFKDEGQSFAGPISYMKLFNNFKSLVYSFAVLGYIELCVRTSYFSFEMII